MFIIGDKHGLTAEVADALRKLDPERLSPIEALLELKRLRDPFEERGLHSRLSARACN